MKAKKIFLMGLVSGIIFWLIETTLFTFNNNFSFLSFKFYSAILAWYLCQGGLYGLIIILLFWLTKKAPSYKHILLFLLFFWLAVYLPLNRPSLNLPHNLFFLRRRGFFIFQAALLTLCFWFIINRFKLKITFGKFLEFFSVLIFSILSFIHLFKIVNQFILPHNYNQIILSFLHAFLLVLIPLCLFWLLAVLDKNNKNITKRVVSVIFMIIVLSLNILLLKQVGYTKGRDVNSQSALRNPKNYNVILIVLDSARAVNFSFEKNAIVYENCISPSNKTELSHAAIFTGLYPSKSFGLFPLPNENAYLDDRFLTLAEVLSDNGFATGFISANYTNLIPKINLTQGFDWYDCAKKLRYDFLIFKMMNHPKKNIFFIHLINRIDRTDSFFGDVFKYKYVTYRDAKLINNEIFKWVSAHRKRPFYLFVNFMDIHSPDIPPDEFMENSSDILPNLSFNYLNQLTEIQSQRGFPFQVEVNEAEARHLTCFYDAEIKYADYELGKLFDFLKANNLYDNTMIIITSDHGEALSEHSHVHHGYRLYQEEIHLPLLIKYPVTMGKKPSRNKELVQTIDIFPTVLSVLGIPVPSDIDGINLLKQKREFAISEAAVDKYKFFSLIRGGYKIIKTIGPKYEFYELYNLKDDPDELINLIGKGTPSEKKLKKELDDWIKDAKLIYPKLPKERRQSEQYLDDLRSLGYVN